MSTVSMWTINYYVKNIFFFSRFFFTQLYIYTCIETGGLILNTVSLLLRYQNWLNGQLASAKI